jgi:hypothetical protein
MQCSISLTTNSHSFPNHSLLRDLSALAFASILSISADAILIFIVIIAAADTKVVSSSTEYRDATDGTLQRDSLVNARLFAGIGEE